MTLEHVKAKLLSIHPGAFEEEDYLAAWINPGVAQYFLANYVEVVPKAIRFRAGRPYQCHRNSLEFAAGHPGAVPYLGFQLFDLYGEWWWYLHSFVIDADGTLMDSGMETETARYFGVPWSWELHDLLTAPRDVDG